MKKLYESQSFIICHNGSDIVHPSKVEPGTYVATGQPNIEEFSTESEWKARLTELGYDITQLDPQPSTPEPTKLRTIPGRQEKLSSFMEKFKPEPEEPKRRGRPKKSVE